MDHNLKTIKQNINMSIKLCLVASKNSYIKTRHGLGNNKNEEEKNLFLFSSFFFLFIISGPCLVWNPEKQKQK